ncbi:tetratricopeptide repeat protein [Pasteurella dagmatis]|uniref:Tetratricopeptide repeat protein n=1 Tax=Pasteurella dagmatis ATCC 43325 TaxID=667128 RepID=C9PN80_9PAST|nr:c-type cytochrome biogenesis protein [Pasteurella dagmatis]EEX50867.1 tetratricopeptide repeat protein [Pasteurella dagmatis ATCC 43325]SNV72427.1 cytochrome c nitrite reductase, subunit NrfG [Pasteurella dagmatis]
MMWWGLLTFTLLIIVLLLLPFGKWLSWQNNYRQQKNIALYREQLMMSSDPELRNELGQRLLEDEKQLQNQSDFVLTEGKCAVRFSLKLNMFLAFLLITVPSLYYFSLPRYTDVEQGEATFLQQQMQLMEQAISQQNEDKITQIQNKLRQDPNDAENWLALGQAYIENNEFDSARISYQNAQSLLGNKPYILGALATALYYQSGQQLTEAVQALLNQALIEDPQEISSLSLIATDAFVQGNYQKAAQTWQKMLDSDRPNIDRRTLIQRIQMAEIRLQQSK